MHHDPDLKCTRAILSSSAAQKARSRNPSSAMALPSQLSAKPVVFLDPMRFLIGCCGDHRGSALRGEAL